MLHQIEKFSVSVPSEAGGQDPLASAQCHRRPRLLPGDTADLAARLHHRLGRHARCRDPRGSADSARDAPERDILILIAFLVALISLLMQGLTLPAVTRLVRLPPTMKRCPVGTPPSRCGTARRLEARPERPETPPPERRTLQRRAARPRREALHPHGGERRPRTRRDRGAAHPDDHGDARAPHAAASGGIQLGGSTRSARGTGLRGDQPPPARRRGLSSAAQNAGVVAPTPGGHHHAVCAADRVGYVRAGFFSGVGALPDAARSA